MNIFHFILHLEFERKNVVLTLVLSRGRSGHLVFIFRNFHSYNFICNAHHQDNIWSSKVNSAVVLLDAMARPCKEILNFPPKQKDSTQVFYLLLFFTLTINIVRFWLTIKISTTCYLYAKFYWTFILFQYLKVIVCISGILLQFHPLFRRTHTTSSATCSTCFPRSSTSPTAAASGPGTLPLR